MVPIDPTIRCHLRLVQELLGVNGGYFPPASKHKRMSRAYERGKEAEMLLANKIKRVAGSDNNLTGCYIENVRASNGLNVFVAQLLIYCSSGGTFCPMCCSFVPRRVSTTLRQVFAKFSEFFMCWGFSQKNFAPGSPGSDDLQLGRPTVSPLLSFFKRISHFQSRSLRSAVPERACSSKLRWEEPVVWGRFG